MALTRQTVLLCMFSVVFPAAVHGQAERAPVRTLQAVRVTTAPILDGRLDDAAWTMAEPASDFVQRVPRQGNPASDRTEARVVYDGQAIYIGLRMYSHPDSIMDRLLRRDDTGSVSDRISVYLDGYHDRRTAVMFSTTPGGSRADVQWFNDNQQDANWDAVWEVATRVDGEGWVAEFRIPFSQLRFASTSPEDAVWGIQFLRQVALRRETSAWAPMPEEAGRMVSLFGELRGVGGIASPRRVEVAPYVVSSVRRAPGNALSPFYDRTDFASDVGADVKVGITQDILLTATINPDFGQVEADPSRVNLTAFEQSYPEKRPFFTEGSEIFRFPTLIPEGNVFYTRRIGRTPQRPAAAPRGGYVENPQTTKVLGAAKLSGKTSNGWSIGVMSAVTGEEKAQLADSTGAISTAIAEPLSHYGVARLSRNLRNGASGVGGVLTTSHRALGDDPRLRLLRSSGYTGGVDARHRFRGRYEASTMLVGTTVHGDTSAIAALQRSATHRFDRPDGTHLTYDPGLTSMQGWGTELRVRSLAGPGWSWDLLGGARSPGLELNEVGFQTYSDVWYLWTELRYRRNTPGKRLRSWTVATQLNPAWSFGNELNLAEATVPYNVQFNSGWVVGGSARRTLPYLAPADLRGGPALRNAGTWRLVANVNSDTRRQFNGRVNTTATAGDEEGAWSVSVTPALNARPTGNFTVSLEAPVTAARVPDQYIRTATSAGLPRYIIGGVDRRTVAMTARVSYTIRPTMSLDVYAQPFLSSGDFYAIREVSDARAAEFHDRYDTFGDDRMVHDTVGRRYAVDANRNGRTDFFVPEPDFTVREFRSTTVLRWEYRAGSTLYLAWSQGRSLRDTAPSFNLGRDMDALFSREGTHTLMLKASYWLAR
jgi:hypothetical protein